ncbi:hypothetical protein CJU89_3498 [Yarrowia sp. B02]|nr:hypothetical protein CJU89_3498 [Yarrowia sp. B02]
MHDSYLKFGHASFYKHTTKMPLEESIIATRQRRANAGNRLKALLDAQEPLDDDDEHNIFMEFEDDQEFELGADEPEIPGYDDEEEEEEEGTASPAPKRRKTSTEADTTEMEDEEGDSDDNAESEAQGSDFFSESESESENDSEPEDAGEKELQKREKEEKARKRLAARKAYEIPTMEKLAKPRVTAQAAARAKAAKEARKPVKRKSTTVEELINSDRRVSRRATAVKNTKEVLERLKEQEEKRAAYVPREKKVVKKLTQAERLAEAKITEQQNIDSLNNFFRQEDLRKKRQREAMLAKRIPLKSFIRFLSSSKLVDPIPLPGVEEIEVVEVKKEEPKEAPKELKEGADKAETTTDEPQAAETEAKDQTAESKEPAVEATPEKDSKDVEMVDATEAEKKPTEEASESPAVKKEEDTAVSATPDVAASEEPEAKDEDSDSDGETPAPAPAKAPKKAKMTVEGPQEKVGTTVVQLLEFAQDRNLSRPEVKRYLLGPQAVVPTGRDYSINNCVVTGKPARFRDSKSKGLYYASLEAFKVIETVREGGYNWNWGLGGVFTEHDGGKCAKNVPDGFYIKKGESDVKEEEKEEKKDEEKKDEDKKEGDEKDEEKKDDEKKDEKDDKDDEMDVDKDNEVKAEEPEPASVAPPAVTA